jgi:alpha-1,3-rhamnosyl/mannosyltransferase
VIEDAGIMCKPDDIEAFTRSMHNLLLDPAFREDCVHHGLLRAKRFTWEETARKTLDVYEKTS